MIRDFSDAYDLKHSILRYFNAAGADTETETGSAYPVDTHLIPLLMQVAYGLMPAIKMYGKDYDTPDGTAIRDYIHVSDLAEAHVLALKHLLNGNTSLTINLGTSRGYSVREVIEAARNVTAKPIPIIESPRRLGDPPVLVASSDQAKQILGWNPVRSDIDNIIRTAWAWRKVQNEMIGEIAE
jgi:UDP-glucose 4-epimerase